MPLRWTHLRCHTRSSAVTQLDLEDNVAVRRCRSTAAMEAKAPRLRPLQPCLKLLADPHSSAQQLRRWQVVATLAARRQSDCRRPRLSSSRVWNSRRIFFHTWPCPSHFWEPSEGRARGLSSRLTWHDFEISRSPLLPQAPSLMVPRGTNPPFLDRFLHCRARQG